MFTRPPDRVIRGDYLARWYLIPRNLYFNIYLHRFRESDDDRALHDHPWWSLSFLLAGELIETLEDTSGNWDNVFDAEKVKFRWIYKMFPYLRRPTLMHRIILESPEAWTLFITGPKQRKWGFRLPDGGWVDHDKYKWDNMKEGRS
jgi:hypothetical protein